MPPKAEEKPGFRARRLSLTDEGAAEKLASLNLASSSTPDQAPRRQRRLSVSPEMGQKAEVEMGFPQDIVGTYSCHGIEPTASGSKGKINQDRGCMMSSFCEPAGGEYKQALFCVYDGHGALGDKCSEYVMKKVAEQLTSKLAAGVAPDAALKEAFVEADDMLAKDRSIDAELSGTTASAMLYRVYQSSGKHEAWVAWAGDTRIVLCQPNFKSMDMSHDHKPDTPAEESRIKKAGGFISPPEEEWGGPARVWLDAEMTLPGLAMARSIGDHLVSSVGVTAEPTVERYDIDPSGGFIVLASDGVWEFIESQAACDLVKSFIDGEGGATAAVTRLIETAAAKWRQEEGDYRDDITAICIKLSPDLLNKAP